MAQTEVERQSPETAVTGKLEGLVLAEDVSVEVHAYVSPHVGWTVAENL